MAIDRDVTHSTKCRSIVRIYSGTSNGLGYEPYKYRQPIFISSITISFLVLYILFYRPAERKRLSCRIYCRTGRRE